MGFARATGTPVVVVGDIDRGGVIASLVGTHAVLDPADAAMVRGFIVNRMRGDRSLFDAGMALIAARTGWAPLGLVPHFPGAARLPAEDAADLGPAPHRPGARLRIAVPVLPRISQLRRPRPAAGRAGRRAADGAAGPRRCRCCDLVILPGSKATVADLHGAAAPRAGTATLRRTARRGGRVLGLCGGYQMLGRRIADPGGIEGPPGARAGLGLLDVDTVLTASQATVGGWRRQPAPMACRSAATRCTWARRPVPAAGPLLRHADGRPDGACSADGLVQGTYVHGLFADDAHRGGLARAPGRRATPGTP